MSVWMIFGLYGNQELEMGMFYSRVINANSFFVKEIKVRALVFICAKYNLFLGTKIMSVATRCISKM